jgi:hypothetical protein
MQYDLKREKTCCTCEAPQIDGNKKVLSNGAWMLAVYAFRAGVHLITTHIQPASRRNPSLLTTHI